MILQQKNRKFLYIAIILLVVGIVWVFSKDNQSYNNQPQVSCTDYLPEACPAGCAVCPPCISCSSISCQEESFCQSIGFEKDWYENIKRQTQDLRNLNVAPSDAIESPITLTGEAKGTWYFEGSFPVILTNWDGLIIAEAIAQAKENWMTEEFVPFEATLVFEKPSYGERGSLIFQKDNPSRLPELDEALEFPIFFE